MRVFDAAASDAASKRVAGEEGSIPLPCLDTKSFRHRAKEEHRLLSQAAYLEAADSHACRASAFDLLLELLGELRGCGRAGRAILGDVPAAAKGKLSEWRVAARDTLV